ncbi:hypothetical protein DITRI_Ditri13aG0155600 [Diplodiscus trichospermus]
MKNTSVSLLLFSNIIKKAFNKAKYGKRRGKARSSAKQCSAFPEELCRQFSVVEIKAAINSFRKDFLLGHGGFGDIYRGIIDDGTLVVTIERFGPFGLQAVREFQTAALLLCQLRHPNFVSFIGFCDEKDEKLIVYEYISNARGLHYLHSGAKHSVIHRNISSRTILPDNEWNPKMSLSKMSHVGLTNDSSNTMVPGTVMYLDPECYLTNQLTRKSDVYAFGIVLFKVLCGRKVIDLTLEDDNKYLTSWACKCIENGTIYNIIDPYLKKKIAPECFKKFVEVAYRCVCETGNGQPEMGEVEMALGIAENS